MLKSKLKSKILFQLTGSIACFKSCQLISKLVQSGYEVQTVASQGALHFIGTATLEGLTGKPVYTDLWESGRMMDHISLNRWADLVIVAPASANYLNKAAAGIGDDLLSTLFLAHDFQKPFLIAPAMNSSMYHHPTTKKSIQKLQEMGIQILESDSGNLACGEKGEGRLLNPDQIFKLISERLNPQLPRKKILITSGGTKEPLDRVRALTNLSTGGTGAALADAFAQQNFEVTYLHAKDALLPNEKVNLREFITTEELEKALRSELSKFYDFIIHAAAVSDYSSEKFDGKISSDEELFTLKLKRNKKLVNQFREWSANKDVQIIAFKMTSTSDEQDQQAAIQKLFTNSRANFVVHNDTHDMGPGHHAFYLYSRDKKISEASNKFELAKTLSTYLKEVTL